MPTIFFTQTKRAWYLLSVSMAAVLTLLNLQNQIEGLQQQLVDPSTLPPSQVNGVFPKIDFILTYSYDASLFQIIQQLVQLVCIVMRCLDVCQSLETILCWGKKSSRHWLRVWRRGIQPVPRTVSFSGHTPTYCLKLVWNASHDHMNHLSQFWTSPICTTNWETSKGNEEVTTGHRLLTWQVKICRLLPPHSPLDSRSRRLLTLCPVPDVREQLKAKERELAKCHTQIISELWTPSSDANLVGLFVWVIWRLTFQLFRICSRRRTECAALLRRRSEVSSLSAGYLMEEVCHGGLLL